MHMFSITFLGIYISCNNMDSLAVSGKHRLIHSISLITLVAVNLCGKLKINYTTASFIHQIVNSHISLILNL